MVDSYDVNQGIRKKNFQKYRNENVKKKNDHNTNYSTPKLNENRIKFVTHNGVKKTRGCV